MCVCVCVCVERERGERERERELTYTLSSCSYDVMRPSGRGFLLSPFSSSSTTSMSPYRSEDSEATLDRTTCVYAIGVEMAHANKDQKEQRVQPMPRVAQGHLECCATGITPTSTNCTRC